MTATLMPEETKDITFEEAVNLSYKASQDGTAEMDKVYEFLPSDVIDSGEGPMEEHLRRYLADKLAPGSGLDDLIKSRTEASKKYDKLQESGLSLSARVFAKSHDEDIQSINKKIKEIDSGFIIDGVPVSEEIDRRVDMVYPHMKELQRVNDAKKSTKASAKALSWVCKEGRSLGKNLLHSYLALHVVALHALTKETEIGAWLEKVILKPALHGLAYGHALHGHTDKMHHYFGVAAGKHGLDGAPVDHLENKAYGMEQLLKGSHAWLGKLRSETHTQSNVDSPQKKHSKPNSR